MSGLATLLEQCPSPNQTMMEHRMATNKYTAYRRGKAIPVSVADLLIYNPENGDFVWSPRPDYPQFNKQYAGKTAGNLLTSKWGKSYIRIRINGVRYLAHRIAWFIVNGPIPDGMEIDHINGDGTDNRIANLRLVTPSANKKNTKLPSNNSSGRIGVSRRANGTFYARAGAGKHLGSFATFEGAVASREKWERENGFHQNHGREAA